MNMQNTDIHPESPEEHNGFGEIKINHSVLASIVRLAALEVNDVCGVGSGFVDQLGGIFSKKESDRGVRVQEDADGRYQIEIRVVMAYGCELGKAAQNVQLAIRNQIQTMTGKEVSRVDVIIEGVKAHSEEKKKEPKEEAPARQWTESPTTD